LAICRIFAGGYQHTVPVDFFDSMENLQVEILRGRTPVTDQARITSKKFPTDVARNDCVSKALEWGADRVLFLDVDHKFEPEAVVRLLESEHDVVTGRYHVKRPPYHPNLYLTPKEAHTPGHYKTVHYGQGVFPVDRCGAGALGLSRRVLETVGFPWFRYAQDPEPPHDLSVSEDFYFCERAQAEGFTIWADWDAAFGHVVTGIVDEHWRSHYLSEMERSIATEKPELAEKLVVCGYPEGYTLPSGQTVTDYHARDLVG
jgi:hypothetical protein